MNFLRTQFLPNIEENKEHILPSRKQGKINYPDKRIITDNVWCNIIKVDSFVKIVMSNGKSYLGQCKKYEPFEKEPLIVLSCWQEFSESGTKIADNSNNSSKYIILNTRNFDRIEIANKEAE